MILEDLKAKKDFTETDRSIADYLLEKKADCVGKTAEQYRMSVLMGENTIDENSSVSSVLNVIPAIYDTAIKSMKLFYDYTKKDRKGLT